MMWAMREAGTPPHPSPLPRGEGVEGAAAPQCPPRCWDTTGDLSGSLSLRERAGVREGTADITPALALVAAFYLSRVSRDGFRLKKKPVE